MSRSITRVTALMGLLLVPASFAVAGPKPKPHSDHGAHHDAKMPACCAMPAGKKGNKHAECCKPGQACCKAHEEKGHAGKGHDAKGHHGKGHDGKGHDAKGHEGKEHAASCCGEGKECCKPGKDGKMAKDCCAKPASKDKGKG